MKTILKGTPRKEWAKKFKCTGEGNGEGGCGAFLLVEVGDLFLTESFDLPTNEQQVTFRCQECGAETDIGWATGAPTNDLPSKRQWLKKHESVDVAT